ncbi:MAG: amino acid ABC transporter substrate-binding protein [Xylophilus ampelinus]
MTNERPSHRPPPPRLRAAARLPALALAACALAPALAAAQAGAPPPTAPASPVPSAPVALAGTLAKVHASGTIALGHRKASLPFSYLSAAGEPVGYSVELCRSLVDAIAQAIQRPLAIRWVPVSAADRFDAVADGRVDLECGSTTVNLERRQRVAFSPVVFVSGTRLLVRRGAPVASFRDLAGRAVAVAAGTTNERAMQSLSEQFRLGLRLAPAPDYAEAFAQVAEGRAAALAADEVLLQGLVAQQQQHVGAAGRGADYAVVGDTLSYEPYAFMYRRDDPQLARVVEDGFRAMARDGEIDRQYRRWFLGPLPASGVNLRLPMNPQLRAAIDMLAAGRPQ